MKMNSISNMIAAIEIANNIFYISHFYDYRFLAVRLLLYSYNNSKIGKEVSCIAIYKKRKIKCKLKLIERLSEDNTVLNILIFSYIIPIFVIINNHKIIINDKYRKHKIMRKATVCVGKMINFYADNMLIQLIESYLYHGADYFIIYKTSCSDKVDNILKYYIKRGVMEVYQFKNYFDLIYGRNKTYMQRIKLNDCLYRSMYTSENLIMTDLDEVLWPTENRNILNMIKAIENNYESKSDVYIFQEKIFRRDYIPFFDRYVHNIEDCDIFSYHVCCDYTWSWPKLLIKNLTKITSVSIHYITGHLKNYTQQRVDSKIGFIRHTRRIYPMLINLLLGNWSLCKSDMEREKIIQNKVKNVKSKIF